MLSRRGDRRYLPGGSGASWVSVWAIFINSCDRRYLPGGSGATQRL